MDYEVCMKCNDIYEDRYILPWCENCKPLNMVSDDKDLIVAQ